MHIIQAVFWTSEINAKMCSALLEVRITEQVPCVFNTFAKFSVEMLKNPYQAVKMLQQDKRKRKQLRFDFKIFLKRCLKSG